MRSCFASSEENNLCFCFLSIRQIIFVVCCYSIVLEIVFVPILVLIYKNVTARKRKQLRSGERREEEEGTDKVRIPLEKS